MFVKIMSGQDLPDEDQRKSFDVYEAKRVSFYRDWVFAGGDRFARAEILLRDGDRVTVVQVTGNVYVMNEHGKTVATFSPNSIGAGASMSSENVTVENAVGCDSPNSIAKPSKGSVREDYPGEYPAD